VSATYLIDSQFMQDKTKFFAGVMSAMSCMLSLGISMICIMSKMDLVKDKKGKLKGDVGRYLDPDPDLVLEDVNSRTNPKFHALNKAVVGLVSEQGGGLGLRRCGGCTADARSRTRTWCRSCRWT